MRDAVGRLESGPIVIARPDRIGDVVISTSCLLAVRERFPKRKIYFLAAELMRPLLEDLPLLDGYIPLSHELKSELKELRAAAIVHLHPNADCYRAATEAGIPVRVGYEQKKLDRYLTHTLPDQREEGLKHEGEYNFDLLHFLGIETTEPLKPQIHFDEKERLSLKAKLPWNLESTRFAILNVSAFAPKREWPLQYFVTLANELAREFDLIPVFVGTDPHAHMETGYLNLCGRTSLGELCWLVRHGTLLVTTDTGTSHLAAVVDCPTVVIFGRTSARYGPTRWRPLSDQAAVVTSPVKRRLLEPTKTYWRRSFAAISAHQVLQAVRSKLIRGRTA